MGKVECLSESLNTTLETIQNQLRGQQVEIQRLSTENTKQGAQLTEQDTQLTSQQIILDEQKENIDQIMSDNDGQQNLIQINSDLIVEQGRQLTLQKSDIEELSIENVEQGTQLAQHQLDIVRFTQSHYMYRSHAPEEQYTIQGVLFLIEIL